MCSTFPGVFTYMKYRIFYIYTEVEVSLVCIIACSLQKFKLNIANTVISQDNSGLKSMNTAELLDLFHLSSTTGDPAASVRLYIHCTHLYTVELLYKGTPDLFPPQAILLHVLPSEIRTPLHEPLYKDTSLNKISHPK